jgi:NADH:ubiquinone oxidoreductase subunit 4 (subunit M)
MVVLGVYPKLVLDRILPSVVHLLSHLTVAASTVPRP